MLFKSLLSGCQQWESLMFFESQFHVLPNRSLPDSHCRVGSKERFTLTEMYSLVEGMEQHGLKWAKIHKDYKDLENKTQVRGRGEGGTQGGGRAVGGIGGCCEALLDCRR